MILWCFRLKVELLADWTETLLKVGSLLTPTNGNSAVNESFTDNSVKRVQLQYKEITREIAKPDAEEVLQLYSSLYAAWTDYCVALDSSMRRRTVQIFENLDNFKKVVNGKQLRYQ